MVRLNKVIKLNNHGLVSQGFVFIIHTSSSGTDKAVTSCQQERSTDYNVFVHT